MNIKEKASRIKTLKNDETFKGVMTEVRERQIDVFTSPTSTIDDREKAHSIICALQAVDDHITAVIDSEKIFDSKPK